MKPFAVLVVALCLTPLAFSQPGQNAALDGRLGILGTQLSYQNNRIGVFPTGQVRFSMATTSCNPGTANLIWFQSSDVRHPYIGFLIARVDNGGGRIVQISDRSWIKHGFFALNNSQCTSCSGCMTGGGTWLGVACSDTYSTSNNASSLAPADDVNPWTAVWTPGQSPNGGNTHCPMVNDSDLTQAGATYYYCAHYVFPSWTQTSVSPSATCTTGGITGSPIPQPAGAPTGLLCEPDANRTNNFASRPFTVTYSGNTPSFNGNVGPQLDGPVVQRWPGATVTSNVNGDPINGPSDGRVYVAVKTSTLLNGRVHYEYAVQNRDNKGGVGAFHLPSCPSANVTNVGFHDVDVPANAANDWTFANNGSELVWTAPAGNSLRWNMLFNFWFDSDAQPVSGNCTLDQATIVGGVNPNFTVATTVPSGMFNVNLGPGCASSGSRILYAIGAPARATLGNATFGVQCSGNAPGNSVDLWYSGFAGTDPEFSPCLLYLGPDLSTANYVTTVTASAFGVASFITGIPNDVSLEGVTVNTQCVEYASGGALFGAVNLSNGLAVRIGNSISNCP
jgi:hypothetical protein